MTPQAEELLATMRREGWSLYTLDGKVIHLVARDVPREVVRELYGACVLREVRGFPHGWHYSALPEAVAETAAPLHHEGHQPR